MAPRVAVIGAGPLGLTAMKNLKDDGFDVTGFESRSYVGGLWRYNNDKATSVLESTALNSSRIRSSITDFPFPEDDDDFPTWQQVDKYLNSYADHFGLREIIHLNNFIKSVEREGDEWVLEIVNDATSRQERFDKLLVATGTFNKPKKPHFEGIERFKGQQLHAVDFHEPEKFNGKNVLLVGLHASSHDVALCLSGHAKQLYLSHRSGVVMLPRYVKNGQTYDASQTIGFQKFATKMMDWCPGYYDWLLDKRIKMLSNEGFPDAPKEWNFRPAPPVYISFFFIGDKLYPLMKSGFAQPVSGVRQVTGPKSIELSDGTILEDIDTILYCTGYDAHIPFLRPEFNPFRGDGMSTNLYRGTFLIHPDPWVRSSLAFVGHAAVLVPGFQMFELAGVAISQTWLGRHQAASFEEMREWETMYKKWRSNMLAKNPFNATQYSYAMPFADHLRWLDKTIGADVMSHFGWSTKAWKFWWNDRNFYNLCKSGIWSPAIWRLFETEGRKSWGGAKEQIYKDNESFKRQTEMRREHLRRMKKKKKEGNKGKFT